MPFFQSLHFSKKGELGIVPAYGILDMNAGFIFSRVLGLRVNISNITNKHYFTKRPSFYSGPGIWPSDGRNASVTIVTNL